MHVTGNEITAGAAALAFVAAMLTLRQRASADRHDAWWARAQWAIDLSLTGRPESRRIGTDAMYVLADDLTATDADLQVLASALHRALQDAAAGPVAGPDAEGPVSAGGSDLAAEPTAVHDDPAVLAAHASAARALVRIHSRLAEPVPDSLRRLAAPQ